MQLADVDLSRFRAAHVHQFAFHDCRQNRGRVTSLSFEDGKLRFRVSGPEVKYGRTCPWQPCMDFETEEVFDDSNRAEVRESSEWRLVLVTDNLEITFSRTSFGI